MEMNNQLIAFQVVGNQFATDTHCNKKTGLLGSNFVKENHPVEFEKAE